MEIKKVFIVLIAIVGIMLFNACRNEVVIPLNESGTINKTLKNESYKEVEINLSNINLSEVCFPNKETVIEIFGPSVDWSKICILNESETNKSVVNESKGVIENKSVENATLEMLNETTNLTSITLENNTVVVVDNESKVVNVGEEIIEKASFLKTIVVNETDIVRLKLSAYDPDNDSIQVFYSWPLDENGFWKTKQGDKGEYIVNITVSDGKTNVTAKVRIIVNDLNLAPEVEIPYLIEVNEGDVINITPKVFDIDNDLINITYIGWLDQPIYETNYHDAGEYDEKIIVSDGLHEVVKLIKIIVHNVNRKPEIELNTTYNVTSNSVLCLKPKVFDPDGDNVTIYYPEPFNASGCWKIPLLFNKTLFREVVVSDGYDNVSKEIVVNVKRFNSEPRFRVDMIWWTENSTLNLSDFVYDPENDSLSVDVSGDFNQPVIYFDFNSSGNYTILVKICDFELCNEKNITLFVKDVNRLPIVSAPEIVEVKENDLVELNVNAYDPDNDVVTIVCSKPLSENCTWKTDYNSSGVYNVSVNVSDGKGYVMKNVLLKVINVNRAPVIENVNDITVKEGEWIHITPVIYDPDGDDVKWSLEGWLNVTDYKTTYDDAGVYVEKIIATDGNATTTKEFTITVENVNRPPVIIGVVVE